MKKIVLLLLATSYLNVSLAQEVENDTVSKPYNTWSVEFNVGQNKGVKPYSSGYYSSNPNNYFNTGSINHFDLGVRKMFSPKFGLKLDFGYDQIKNQENSGSLDFKTIQYRVGLQGIANLGRILQFEAFTSRLGLLGHAGIQVSQLTPQMGINKDETEDNGGVMFGLTPQLRLTSWLVFTGDFTIISNVRQHFNWDGTYSAIDNNLSGLMYNTSVGFTAYLGSKEKHADWYVEADRLKELSGKDDEARSKIDKINKMLEDTDRDGIPDYRDVENNTPNGIAVDAKGRFIDVNKNGVPDELERTAHDGKDGEHLVSKDDAIKTLIEKGYVNVFFDVNKDYPNSGSTNNVYQIINFLRNYPDAKATLKGYADVRGNEAKNLDLSNRRAKKLYDILIASGIDPARVTIVGEGIDSSFPTTQIGLDLARRVSFKLE